MRVKPANWYIHEQGSDNLWANVSAPRLMLKYIFLLLIGPLSAFAQTKLSVAAAANLIYALESLHAEFKKAEPGIELSVNTGASGNLVAQIQNGAPFDVFLSADVDYPQELIKRGAADAKSFTTFAIGRLVLWTTRPNLALPSIEAAVRNGTVQKLAIANVRTAPYGRAAAEAMKRLGVWVEAEPKIITGENITQTAQFVETGNADAGFVAMSLVISSRLKDQGRWLEVPPELYSPLEHAGVITKRGSSNPAAARYLAFLHSPAARTIFERYGYRVPAK
jgi:molybdate transport system substrate-binding protein